MATATSNIPFTFREDTHEYLVDGRVVLSVTQVLTQAGYTNYETLEAMLPEVLERKRQIGTLVHSACHYFDEDSQTLPADVMTQWEEEQHPIVKARLRAYKNFRAATGYTPLVNEHQGIGELAGMKCGYRFDSVGTFHGRPPYVVLEIKNVAGQPQRSWALQTAAYSAFAVKAFDFLRTTPASAITRIALQLFDDETFRLHSSRDQQSKIFRSYDIQVFQAALAVVTDQQTFGVSR